MVRRQTKINRKGTKQRKGLFEVTKKVPKGKKTKQPRRRTAGEITISSWFGNS